MSDAKRQIEEQLEEIAIQNEMEDSTDHFADEVSRYLESLESKGDLASTPHVLTFLAGYKAAMRWAVDNLKVRD